MNELDKKDVGASADAEVGSDVQGVAAKKRVRLRATSKVMIYIIVASVLFLTLFSWLQARNMVSGLLLTEYGLVMGGAIIFLLLQRKNLKQNLRFRGAKFSVFVKVFFMSFFIMPLAGVGNFITIYIIEKFGMYRAPALPIGETPSGLVFSVFLIAVSAGVCEEIMYRGAILSTLEDELGRRKAAVITAFLFALFHFNFANIFGPLVLGLIYGYITHITGSIFPAMFGHFTNNSIAVVANYFVNKSAKAAEKLAEAAGGNIEDMVASEVEGLDLKFGTPSQIVGVALIVLIIVLICFFVVRALLKSIKKSYPRRPSELTDEPVEERLDYPSTDYKIWPKAESKFGGLATGLLVFMIAAYAVLNYFAYFI